MKAVLRPVFGDICQMPAYHLQQAELNASSGSFFLLAHPEDGLDICLLLSLGLLSVSMAFPKYQIVYFQ